MLGQLQIAGRKKTPNAKRKTPNAQCRMKRRVLCRQAVASDQFHLFAETIELAEGAVYVGGDPEAEDACVNLREVGADNGLVFHLAPRRNTGGRGRSCRSESRRCGFW